MELIPGDTLADSLKRGPIPVEEALNLALQIAEALEAAHEKGVIHRDLKPANIKMTPEGMVKILDFGLAKAYVGDTEASDLADSPTLSDAATRQGVILGTAAYMSPEQATGKSVDKRADIWAFGVVLYEMLTGKKLFGGESVTETIAGVIKSEPDWSSLPAELHPRIRFMLERCLKKVPRNRYSGISDARVDIQEVLADPDSMFGQSGVLFKTEKNRRVSIPWVAVVFVLGLIIVGLGVWVFKPAEPKRVTRLEYELPEGQLFNKTLSREYGLAVSPDGSRFVYTATDGLYLRDMDTLEARHMAGTDNGSLRPFFSPDNKWIGYWSRSDGKLKKVGVSGFAPIVLCDIAAEMAGARWDTDGTIVFSEVTSGVMRVSSNGGTPETLIKASVADLTKDGLPIFPQMLPDGDTLLFTSYTSPDIANSQIVIQSLRSGEREVLLKGFGARYLPTGHVIYSLVNNDIANLFAAPFDLDKLKVTGSSVSVLEGATGGSVSDSGTLIYIPGAANVTGAAGPASPGDTLVWVDREGNAESLGAGLKDYRELDISPDDSKVALSITDTGNTDIWVWDIPHKTLTRLTSDKANNTTPVWTPDGKRIVFSSTRGETYFGLYRRSADGVGEVEPLGARPDWMVYPRSFSPDGKFLATSEFSLPTYEPDIGMMSMEGDRDMSVLLKDGLEPRISPDGRYMAYQTNESGTDNIYVRPFPDVNGGKWHITNSGNSPLWSPVGGELFYRNDDSTMVVEVETESAFKYKNPKVLFRGAYISSVSGLHVTPWDIDHDGKRFLMIKPPAATVSEPSTAEPAPTARQPKIIIVTNWFEELKELVPVE